MVLWATIRGDPELSMSCAIRSVVAVTDRAASIVAGAVMTPAPAISTDTALKLPWWIKNCCKKTSSTITVATNQRRVFSLSVNLPVSVPTTTVDFLPVVETASARTALSSGGGVRTVARRKSHKSNPHHLAVPAPLASGATTLSNHFHCGGTNNACAAASMAARCSSALGRFCTCGSCLPGSVRIVQVLP